MKDEIKVQVVDIGGMRYYPEDWLSEKFNEAENRIKELVVGLRKDHEHLVESRDYYVKENDAVRNALQKIIIERNKALFDLKALQSPSSANDTPDRYERYLKCSQLVWDKELKKKLDVDDVVVLLNSARKSSPVSVDINREWIDRNKQMPEPHIQVLISIQYGMGNRSYALSYCTKRFPDVFDHFNDGIITHWTPLPEHPALSKASSPKQE